MISVVIPACNAAGTLGTLLDSLGRSGFRDLEVIVVDDGSRDGTEAAARSFPGTRLVRLPENRGPAVARNRGAAAAKGDVLLFLDADVAVFPETLSRVAERFREPAVEALNGTYATEPLRGGLFGTYKALLVQSLPREEGRTDSLEGFCFAVRRPLFEAVGGFDESIARDGAEDFELGLRILPRTPIVLDRAIEVRHHFPGFSGNARRYWRRIPDWFRVCVRARWPFWRSSFAAPGFASLAAFYALALAALSPSLPTGGPAVAAAALFVFFSRRFLALAGRRRGWARAAPMALLHFGCGVVVGLAIHAGAAAAAVTLVRSERGERR